MPAQSYAELMVIKHVVNSLKRVSGDDENLDQIMQAVEEGGVGNVFNGMDPAKIVSSAAVQQALLKFVSDTIGNFEYAGEVGGNENAIVSDDDLA